MLEGIETLLVYCLGVELDAGRNLNSVGLLFR